MPRKYSRKKSTTVYRSRKRSRKTVTRKRRGARKRYNRVARINRRTTGLPPHMLVKLKYFENNYAVTIAGTPGAPSTVINLAVNSPYDPYTGIGGKSALYYQFWHQAYVYSRVMAAKVTITWGKQTDSNTAFVVTMNPQQTNYAYTDVDDAASQPGAKVVRRFPDRIGGSSSMSYYLPIHKVFRYTAEQYRSQLPGPLLDGQAGSSPTTPAYLRIGFWKVSDSGAESITVYANVKITFYTHMYQRVPFIEVGFDAGDETADTGEVDKADILPPLWALQEE